MDLRHLRTFITVAEQGTVSKASLRLGVAQPALSRQIGDLEAELGVRLFDRIRRRLVLTVEGEQLLGDCRRIVDSVGSLTERAHLFRQPDKGVLRVAATPQTIEGVFSTFLHRYAELRPNVQIKLSEGVGGTMPLMLERGEIQLGVSLLQAVQADSHSIQTQLLAPLEFLAVGAADGDLEDVASMDIRRLGSRPLLLFDSSFFVRTTFDAACRIAAFTPNIFLESRAPHALLALAEAGHGVAIIPSVLPTQRYKVRIVSLTCRGKPLREHLTLVWDRRRMLPPYAADFCQLLAAHVRETFPITQATAAKAGVTPTVRVRKAVRLRGADARPRR